MNEKSLNQLLPASIRTEEERKANGRKGGIKSVEIRRKKKVLRELVSAFLTCPAEESIAIAVSRQFKEYKKSDVTNALAMTVALYRRALKGDPRAFEVLRDTIGEKPVAEVDHRSSDGSMSPVSAIDLSSFSAEQLAALRGELDAKKI